jgi:sugar lactone lactonase YvrE
VILNPDDLTIKDRFDINLDPFDLEVDKDGYIYVSSGSGQSTYIYSYSRADKTKIAQKSVYPGSLIRYNEQNNTLYIIGNTEVTSIDKGIFKESYYPTYSEGSKGTNAMLSPDGKYFIGNSGKVFTTSSAKAIDLMYATDIGSSFSDIVFDIQNNKFYTGVANQIVAYNYDYFNRHSTINLTGTVNRLFKQNDKFISLSTTGEIYYIETANTSYAQEIPKETYVNAIKLYGKIVETIYDKARNKVYAADTGLRNLYIVNMDTKQIERTIKLPYFPNSLCLSEDNNKIFISNNDPNFLVTEIDLSTQSVTRNLSFTAEMNADVEGHGHIYNKGGRLYVATGEW